MAPQNIAQAVLADLRRISAGLSLPELGQLSVRETLLLATERHERATGTPVSVMFDHLPDRVDDQRKTCIYRIVQEGLNNAQRHGGGRGQRVSAGLVDGQLTLSVSDDGPARDTTPAQIPRGNHAGLGLDGLRNRLKVFGGALTTEVTATGGFVLRTTLPMA
jgi:signal transduction histidine kinase